MNETDSKANTRDVDRDVSWLLHEKYNGQKTEDFLADLKRLEAGEPLAYLIGHVPFLNTTIYLDSRPLIPRGETEFWTESILMSRKDLAQSKKRPCQYKCDTRVLDLCAGSGCIGVALAKNLALEAIDFAEIVTHHHATIKKNMEANAPKTKTTIFGGSLFEDIPKDRTYDLIVANPPYIDPALDRTEESVKQFEPHNALYGGMGGTELIDLIVCQLNDRLNEHGICYIEHEPEQVAHIQQLTSHHGLFATTHTDQYNVPRYSVISVAQ